MNKNEIAEVYLNEYETYKDALQNIEEVYNSKLLHSPNGHEAPIDFEKADISIEKCL